IFCFRQNLFSCYTSPPPKILYSASSSSFCLQINLYQTLTDFNTQGNPIHTHSNQLKSPQRLVFDQVVLFVVMASSSTFSAWNLNGSILAPKASKSNAEFICNYLNGSFKQTFYSLSISASANTSHSWVSPNGKAIDWRRGKSSLKTGVECRALEVETKPSFSLGSKFQLEDVIEAQQFDRDTLSAIFNVALELEKIEKNSLGSQILKGYLMATLFYEPSTRTRLSFESAMKRLGAIFLTAKFSRHSQQKFV
ncbi:hypothetical protein Pfo_022937, partial [Paulownia fortunei]